MAEPQAAQGGQNAAGVAAAGSGAGAIHDIGYRHYGGPRLGARYIQRSLYVDSLRGAFGFGRSARSKVMPLLQLGVLVLPAVVMVIVTSTLRLTDLPVEYTSYPIRLQIPVVIFVASQAPALMSRDLRFGVVALYFSRPLSRRQYVHAKLAAMASAVFLLLALPLTVLFAGALLAELPLRDNLLDYLRSLAAAALHAVVLAGIGLLVAALTPRRGLGVAAIVAVLLVLSGVQGIVAALGQEFRHPDLAGYAGLLSPFSLVDGVVATALGAPSSVAAGPPGTSGGVLFGVVLVLVVAATYAALAARYTRGRA